MGLVPIAIGIKELLELWNNKNKLDEEEQEVSKEKLMLQSKKKGYYHHLSFLAVAAVTISNGGDNIGIYIPLFASYNSSSEVTTLISVFMVMTAVWCAIGYYLVKHPLLERRMRRFGQYRIAICPNRAWSLHPIRCLFVLVWFCNILLDCILFAASILLPISNIFIHLKFLLIVRC